jgi:hypothetical protein
VLEKLGPQRYGEIGFAKDIGFANRFAARYRFATSITQVELRGYTEDTHAGYTALARASFAYSAFDALLDLVGVPYKDASKILQKYPTARWLNQLRKHDPKQRFFEFVRQRVAGKHETANLEQFLKVQGCDITALARSVRHIFFHGELTPNAGGSLPQDVCRICDCLYSNLVEVMDTEFSARLAPFEEKRAATGAKWMDVDDDDF